MVIGITGSSGAGKSTVCEILKEKYNFKTIVADEIARHLSENEPQYIRDIVDKFGTHILLENGELNRRKIAKIIYNNESQRNQLNSCTFKYIVKEIKEKIEELKGSNIAIDAPLLFEASLDKICDTTIAVISENFDQQVERIIKRDGISEEEAVSRIKAQQTNEFYIKSCEYKLINNISLNKQIEDLLKIISA